MPHGVVLDTARIGRETKKSAGRNDTGGQSPDLETIDSGASGTAASAALAARSTSTGAKTTRIADGAPINREALSLRQEPGTMRRKGRRGAVADMEGGATASNGAPINRPLDETAGSGSPRPLQAVRRSRRR